MNEYSFKIRRSYLLVSFLLNLIILFDSKPDDGLPGDISIVEFTTTTIRFNWTDIGNDMITGYEISIEPVAGGAPPPKFPIALTAPREFEFGNLDSCTEYLIKVYFLGTNPMLVRSRTQRTRK